MKNFWLVLFSLAACGDDEPERGPAAAQQETSCESGDNAVSSSDACLQEECSACYQLTDGAWCTGERECQATCDTGDEEIASSAECLAGCAACYQLEDSRWCTGSRSGCDTSSDLEYDDAGCLTFTGASAFCGFDSDSTICEYAIDCRNDADLDQCKIDCEMSTTLGGCIDAASVDCVIQAVDAQSCPDLQTCPGWALVY